MILKEFKVVPALRSLHSDWAKPMNNKNSKVMYSDIKLNSAYTECQVVCCKYAKYGPGFINCGIKGDQKDHLVQPLHFTVSKLRV